MPTITIAPIQNDTASGPLSRNPFLRLTNSNELLFLEIQGSIAKLDDSEKRIGKIVQEENGKIYLLVGYQKMEGRIVHLEKPFAVLRRSRKNDGNGCAGTDGDDEASRMRVGDSREEDNLETRVGRAELELIEVIRRKIFFGIRPEPISEISE